MTTELMHSQLAEEAAHFDEVWEQVSLKRIDDKLIIPGVQSLEGKKVLICSCGAGTEPVKAARAGAEVYAVDISPVGVQKAVEMAAFNNVKICAEVMDLHSLKYSSGFFDVIYGSAILHHLDCARAGREFYRCLRPDGIAYFFGENSDRNPILRFFYKALSRTDSEGRFKKFLLFKRNGTLHEHILSHEDIRVLSEEFSGNISIINDNFMFLQKLSHVAGGRFLRSSRILDELIGRLLPPLKFYSYEQNVCLRRGAGSESSLGKISNSTIR